MGKQGSSTRSGSSANYYYSDEDIAKANAVSIPDLARMKGYQVKDMSQRYGEIKGQGGLSIDKAGNRWYCHSTNQGGGPIQLIMYLDGVGWQEAMAELLGDEKSYTPYERKMDTSIPELKELKLPDKNNTYRHVFAYLVQTRKIHQDVVKEFVDKKLLYENQKKSCVFVGVDQEGTEKYASIRSTNTMGEPFKGEASGSDKRYGFAKLGTNDKLTIVEAPIDLLSYMSIYHYHGLSHLIKDDHILSLGGVSDMSLKQYLQDHPEVKSIQLGLDNDKAGNEACNSIYKNYSDKYQIKRISFQQKDFNEVLKADLVALNLKRAKQMQELQEEVNIELGQECETA